ncbi:unnamed protein product [Haemonchus placei]|uniref:Uncharacterized protein n=1 Tax=Haemonchus placei TaxID=6290 RepID=A0A0N4X128_HAEPC|nr:unnamed protein product [Haemonchus placei]
MILGVHFQRSILPEGATIRYSVENNGIDASKKTVSSTSLDSRVNNRTIERIDAARVFASIRDSSLDSSRPSDILSRRPTMDGLEGIRLRSRPRRSLDQAACAPPLPPRTHAFKSSDSLSDDRTILNGTRHNKSPIPTPITDLSDLQRF